MKLVPIQQVGGHIRAGVPLPFGVRDAEGKLLLAKGQVVPSEQMREALLNRGVFVDMDELRDPSRRASDDGEDFFARWEALQTRLSVLLRTPQDTLFLPRVKECAGQLMGWAERFPDQLLFVVIQHDHSRGTSGNTPIVSAVMNRHGDALGSPVRRDTAAAGHAITGLASAQALRVKLSPHQLYDRRYEA